MSEPLAGELRLGPAFEADIDALAALLVETVADNGNVGFVHPLSLEDAHAFWADCFNAAAHGKRVILGAWQGRTLVGTGSLAFSSAPSQPHRAELTKVMTTPRVRGLGIGARLIGALEQAALDHGKTLLTLDATVVGGATSLYRRLGYRTVGDIPLYAYKPLGGLEATRIFYKLLADKQAAKPRVFDTAQDERWMQQALDLAERAQLKYDEIPVGALVVDAEGRVIGEGFNRNILDNDPSAHAEIVALRQAGQATANHRLPGCTLYVTLEPCAMCAMALVHARIDRVVFAARDPKTGAAGSVFDLLSDPRHNHQLDVRGGVLGAEASKRLTNYFRAKRGRPLLA